MDISFDIQLTIKQEVKDLWHIESIYLSISFAKNEGSRGPLP